jgi:Rieske Fe-S protein
MQVLKKFRPTSSISAVFNVSTRLTHKQNSHLCERHRILQGQVKSMNEKSMDRRSVIKGLVLTSSGVAIGSSLLSQAQAMFDKSIEIGALSKLAKDYDSIPFALGDGGKAILVRVPAPKDEAMLKTGRVIKSGTVYLSAYTLVCTHNGCEPAAPNSEGLLLCPCHGAKFNSDGTVNKGPARKPLAGIKIEVKAGKIMATGMLMG